MRPDDSSVAQSAGTPFRDLLKFPANLRYIAWVLAGRRNTFTGQLRRGPKLTIRPSPSSDWENAYEVFRLRTYDTGTLPLENVGRIVDLGGNVGYSCLFWCSKYPSARVLTYEPHPVHCEILLRHMQMNGYSGRVTLICAGAASRESTAVLTDNGFRSAVLSAGSTGAGKHPVIEVKMVDFFETVGPERIDILKIDIEGGEYDLMEDARFDAIAKRTRCVVMEWHKRSSNHYGGKWCAERLRKFGFTLSADPEPEKGAQDIGTITAFQTL